jgi:hypothetical protein
MEFFNKVHPDKLTDNLHLHVKKEPGTKGFASCPVENNPNPNWWIIRLRPLYGHPGTADFYTIITKLPYNHHCGQYKDLIKRSDNFL